MNDLTPPKFPASTLTNPENQGITIRHDGKTFLIIEGELKMLTEEYVRYFDRFGYYQLNYLVLNNLLA